METTSAPRIRRFAVAAAVALGSLIPLAGTAGAASDGGPVLLPKMTEAKVTYNARTNELVILTPGTEWSVTTNKVAGPRVDRWISEVSTDAPLVAGTGCSQKDPQTAICVSSHYPDINGLIIP